MFDFLTVEKIKETRTDIHKIKNPDELNEEFIKKCFEDHKQDTIEEKFMVWLKKEVNERKEYLIRKEKYEKNLKKE